MQGVEVLQKLFDVMEMYIHKKRRNKTAGGLTYTVMTASPACRVALEFWSYDMRTNLCLNPPQESHQPRGQPCFGVVRRNTSTYDPIETVEMLIHRNRNILVHSIYIHI